MFLKSIFSDDNVCAQVLYNFCNHALCSLPLNSMLITTSPTIFATRLLSARGIVLFFGIIKSFNFFATDCLMNVDELPESTMALISEAPSIRQVVYEMSLLPSQARYESLKPAAPRVFGEVDLQTFAQCPFCLQFLHSDYLAGQLDLACLELPQK